MSQTPNVRAVTTADFSDMVIERSHQVPVLVDFWAGWCAPCRALAPVLHALAEELQGAILVATVDTDAQPELARRYQVRSLPTVKLFSDGEVVDEFVGALPASQVRSFLEPYIVRESDRLADRAQRIADEGDGEAASTLFQQALDGDPENLKVRLRYVRTALKWQDLQLAAELLEGVPLRAAQDPEVLRLKALLGFNDLVESAHSDTQLEANAGAAAPQPELLREFAARKVLCGDYAGAMDLLMRLLETQPEFADRAAHKDLLALFGLVDDPTLVGRYRRRMAALLH